MSNRIWEQFMTMLVEDKDKLDEFCNLPDADIEQWLVTNNVGVTLDQLHASSLKLKLSDSDLEDVAGGRVPVYSLQDIVKAVANRWLNLS